MSKIFYKSFEEFSKLLNASGLSITDFMEKIGQKRQNYYNWEKQNGITYENWVKITATFPDLSKSIDNTKPPFELSEKESVKVQMLEAQAIELSTSIHMVELEMEHAEHKLKALQERRRKIMDALQEGTWHIDDLT